MFVIIAFLKKTFDKLYYSKYTIQERGALIRTMFPWINKVGEYERLNSFLKDRSQYELDEYIWAIMAYYWWEVETLTMKWEFNKIERYQWLVDFCQAIRDYSNEVYNLNNKK